MTIDGLDDQSASSDSGDSHSEYIPTGNSAGSLSVLSSDRVDGASISSELNDLDILAGDEIGSISDSAAGSEDEVHDASDMADGSEEV